MFPSRFLGDPASFFLIGLLLLCIAPPEPAQADECVDPTRTIQWIGNPPGAPGGNRVIVQDNLAFVAVTGQGLWIADVADPAHPVVKGRASIPGGATDVALWRGRAFVAGRDGSVTLLDVTDADDPVPLDTLQLPDQVLGVSVERGLVCMAAADSGLWVAGLEEAELVLYGHAWTADVARDVVLSGTWAFVACTFAGLLVFDLNDPKHPELVATLDTPGRAYGLAIHGDVAYVADLNGGLAIADVSNPAAPSLLTQVPLEGYTYDAAISEGLAYVAATDPLTEKGWLHVIDVSRPASARFLASAGSWQALGVAARRRLAFLACADGGVEIFDVSFPKSTPPSAIATTPETVDCIVTDGTLAYTLTGQEGHVTVRCLDVAQPWLPQPLGFLDIPRVPRNTESASARSALPPSHSSSGPSPLTGEEKFFVCGYHCDLSVRGSRAVLIGYRLGIVILDLADPRQPVVLSRLERGGYSVELSSDGALAFVGTLDSLIVVDLSDPATPRISSTLAVQPWFGAVLPVRQIGTSLWVVHEREGLVEYDLTDPHLPRLARLIHTSTPVDAAIREDGLVALSTPDGLELIDVSVPGDPVTLAQIAVPDRGTPFFGEADLLFLSGRIHGLVSIEVSDPRNPRYLGTIETPQYLRDAVVVRDWVLLANCPRGLFASPAPCSDALDRAHPPLALVAPIPNPSRREVLLSFTLEQAGSARAEVFDAAGRRIRTLFERSLERGSHEARWDGRDESGRLVVSGIYLVRLEGGGIARTTRVVRLP